MDTLDLADGDSVWVRLSALGIEIPIGDPAGLFDAASLTVLGSVPVAAITWGALKVRYP